MQLKGYLREKLEKRADRLKQKYPPFSMKEPSLIITLPYFKDFSRVNIKYPLLEPIAFAGIKWSPDDRSLTYSIIEPSLTPDEKKKLNKICSMLTEIIDIKMSVIKERKSAAEYLQKKVGMLLSETGMKLSKEEYMKIMYYIVRDFVGLNELEPLMHDPYIEDIGCSGLGIPVYVVHRRFGSMKTSIKYNDFEYLNNFVVKLSERCGRYISYATPLLDGTLPDGSRVQASLAKDITTKGPTFSIRRFRKNPFSPVDILNMNTASADLLAYLWVLIEYSCSMLVCGGVASGKTTFLNLLSMFIPPERKVVSIEDTREINIPHDNWIPSVTRTGFGIPEVTGKKYGEIELFDLLKESFRMKPDYVIVGEVRGKEAYVLFQGMASGNPSLGTMHAGSVEDVIKRLEAPPIELSPSLIESLDLIIIMTPAEEIGKSARRVKNISEIQSMDTHTGKALTLKTFTWMPSTDDFKKNIEQSQILHKLSFERGISYQNIMKEVENRERVLRWMQKHSIVHFVDVCELINLYYKDRDTIMKWVENDLPPYRTKTKKMVREQRVLPNAIVDALNIKAASRKPESADPHRKTA